jgi:hypothetical protein
MKEFLNSKYVQEFQKAKAKLDDECVFKPNLSQSRKGQEPEAFNDPQAVFNRTLKWRDRSDQRI